MAASATFALKAGLCVRRARLAIVTPDMRHSRRSQADFPLIGLSEFAQPPLSSDQLRPHHLQAPATVNLAMPSASMSSFTPIQQLSGDTPNWPPDDMKNWPPH